MSGPRGCIFAPEDVGALLSHAGGRWKLWREKEAAIEVAHNDASESYSAACWIAGKGGQVLVLGCTSGRVQAWDPGAGELLGQAEAFRAIAQGADCAVTGLAATSSKRGTVFAACNGSPEILEVGLVDGTTRGSFRAGKAGLCRLAAAMASGRSAQEWLLAASPSAGLKLWRLPAAGSSLSELTKAHARLAAPANPATCLDLCTVNGHLLALCADGTMQADFFNLGPEDGRGEKAAGERPKESARVLSCHERLAEARLARASLSSGQLVVVGFGTSIVACWTFELKGGDASTRTVAPAFTVSASELGGKILCARWDSAGSAQPVSGDLAMVVAHGPSAQPSFSKVLPPAKPKGASKVVGLSQAPSKQKASASAAAAETAKVPTVLGPAELAAMRRQELKRSAEEDGGSQKRQKQPMPASRPATSGSNLSLAPVLRQGLRSKDGASLDKSLVIRDKELMETSIGELSGSEAFDLLQECAKRLLDRPMEGQVYCAWIQRVLLHHCTFIRAQPALKEALRPLHDATAARCAKHEGLARLRGRLQCLIGLGKQVVVRKAQEQKTVRAPLLEYVEGDDELDEEEDDDEEEAEQEDAEDEDDDEDIDLDDDWLSDEDL